MKTQRMRRNFNNGYNKEKNQQTQAQSNTGLYGYRLVCAVRFDCWIHRRKGRNNLKGVEIYKAARYFIMTGDIVLYHDIIENQEAIDYVVEKYFPETRSSSDKVVVGRDKIYSPVWEEPIVGGRVKLRPVYPRIPDGSRNICLTSLAGMLHNQGYSKAQIYEELLYANTVACDPPLDRNELRTICNSVTRYKR